MIIEHIDLDGKPTKSIVNVKRMDLASDIVKCHADTYEFSVHFKDEVAFFKFETEEKARYEWNAIEAILDRN